VDYYSSIYGLGIRLNERIPGVATESPRSIDIEIIFGSMPSWFNPADPSRKLWYVAPDETSGEPRLTIWQVVNGDYFNLKYADGTEFLVNGAGSKIWAVWPPAELTLEDTATYLLGPVMGFVLLLRGHVCLHASAVVIADQAVALLGPAGSGKSTTAAAFAEAGYGILAEDVLRLDEKQDRYYVRPAYPCIRLWPASVKALYGSENELPRLTPTWDKCYLDLTQDRYGFRNELTPLGAIYLLGERSAGPEFPSLQDMSDQETMISLIANTYATYLLDKSMRAREFTFLSRLIKKVPIRMLAPHADAAQIPALCQLIIDDFENLHSNKNAAVAPAEHLLNV
jgi:hypothetical protein